MVEAEPDRDERQIQELSASLHDAFDGKPPEAGTDEALMALMGIDPDDPRQEIETRPLPESAPK